MILHMHDIINKQQNFSQRKQEETFA